MEAPRKPLSLGLVGSIGAGKSLVAEELERRGAEVYRADAHVHDLLRREDVAAEVAAAFGEAVLDDHGRVDRERLGERVFAEPDALARLERILHPRTLAEIQRRKRLARERGDVPLMVIDAPLLLEAGYRGQVDRLLVVDAPREQRCERVRSRGWEEAELARREARLIPIEAKKEQADYVIVNDGSPEDLRDKVGRLWREIV